MCTILFLWSILKAECNGRFTVTTESGTSDMTSVLVISHKGFASYVTALQCYEFLVLSLSSEITNLLINCMEQSLFRSQQSLS
jgi:hypothetical protein